MAKSARQASLESQRNPYARLRVLSPQNSAVNTIAKKTATAELEIMTDRYNDGLVTNEEFRSFLQRQLVNPGISESDKADIQDKVRDFDTLVRKDQLEAVFRSAPENSLEKVTAATAISNFYKDRAATMAPGTPAQSQALENAGQWENQAISIQNTVEKKARSNMRYLEEQKIYQIPSGTSEQAYAKAEMYVKLGDKAAADGDATEANRFYAQAQQYSTMGDQYVSKEGDKATREQRSSVLDYLNQATNAYHDGTIDANQYYQILSEVDGYALENGDTSLQLKVNSESDRVAKIEAKGGLRRGTVGAGLPVVLGKGKGGGSGTMTSWDQADYEYSNGIRALDAEFKAGLSNPEEYGNDVGVLLEKRQQDLLSRIQTAEAIAAENPNAKITFNGKKTRAAEVVEALYKETEDLDGQVQAYNNGTFTLLEIPPDQFNTSGGFKKSGKNVATYQLVDTSAIPPEAQDNYMMDEDGILHLIQGEYVPLTADQLENVRSGYYTDENGQSYKVITDQKTGMSTIRVNSRVDLYDPTDRTKKVSLTLTGEENTVPSYEKAFTQENERIAKEAERASIEASKQNATVVPNMDLRSPIQKAGEMVDKITQPVGKVVQNVAQKIPEQIKQPIQQGIQNIQQNVEQAKVEIPKVVDSVSPIVQKAVQQAPIQVTKQGVDTAVNKAIGYTPSQMGNTQTISPITGTAYKPTIQMNGTTMVKQYDPGKQEITYQKVQPAPYLEQNKQAPSLATKITTAVKQSPFDFLKKKLGF